MVVSLRQGERHFVEEWVEQLQGFVDTLDALGDYINVTLAEEEAIRTLKTRWGTTPYFASLMDPDDPTCPIRRQVVPSLEELENRYGMEDFLVWKENRATEEVRPDTIARHYRDRVAFTITDACAVYCRHCFRKEMVLDGKLKLRFDVEEGLKWLREHTEVRDVLITGGDPFLLSDEKLEYIVRKLREIPHIELIRFGTRSVVTLPQRITSGLTKALGGLHDVPVWVNIQCNHPREITDEVRRAVYDLLSVGVNVGNQAVLLKGINDDPATFKELHLKLVKARVRPYYLFYCQSAPGIDHFRTPIEKGNELIRGTLQGHTTGLAQPAYVVSTNIGKLPLDSDYYFVEECGDKTTLRNYKGEETKLPKIPE